ncbi:MAG: hypothetical protein ABIP94_03450 [Planctomycetota bacterium]
MATHNPVEIVSKALRNKVRAGGEVTVGAADVGLLLDELRRLQQSNDRLRRQNRRVRLKLQRAGLTEGLASPSEDPATSEGQGDGGPTERAPYDSGDDDS